MSKIIKRSPYISFTYSCNLNCDYCFAKGLRVKNRGFISFDDLVLVVEWLVKQGVRSVGLFGGEPTFHPEFNKLICYAASKISIFLPTNGLFEESKKIPFLKGEIKGVVLHFNLKAAYMKSDWELFNRNAEFLSSLNILTSVRFVIDSMPLPKKEILSFYRKHRVPFGFAFAKPGAFKKNRFLALQKIKETMSLIEKDILSLRKNGINAFITGSLPFCFVEDYLHLFSSNSDEPYPRQGACCLTEDGEFDASIIIQPDLTTNICMGLPLLNPKRIVEYETLDEAKKFFEKDFLRIQKQPLFKECKKCEYYNNYCYGGCLAYKL